MARPGKLASRGHERLRKTVDASRKRAEDRISNSIPPPPPNMLVEEALADLNYLEPKRTRDRVIACFNEAFGRIMRLEQMHREVGPTKKPKHR